MIASIVQGVLGVAYPIVIFFALAWLEPREIGLVVLALAGLRLITARFGKAMAFAREVWLPALAIGVVAVGTAIWNDPMGLLLAPVMINASLLLSFGSSLFGERPIVERFARLQAGDLNDAEVRYCRSVTRLWCVFFVVNGSIALYLALAGDVKAWALFTGFISYVLIGLLFASEYVYRHWRFRRYVGGIADPLLKRCFPPRPEASAAIPEDGNHA